MPDTNTINNEKTATDIVLEKITALEQKITALETKNTELEKTNKELTEYNRSLFKARTSTVTVPNTTDRAALEKKFKDEW